MSYNQLLQTCRLLQYNYRDTTITEDRQCCSITWTIPFNVVQYNQSHDTFPILQHLIKQIFPHHKYSYKFDTTTTHIHIIITSVDKSQCEGYSIRNVITLKKIG